MRESINVSGPQESEMSLKRFLMNKMIHPHIHTTEENIYLASHW